MTHGDDDGVIMPPRVASAHVVLLPIVRKESDRSDIMAYCDKVAAELRATRYNHRPVRVEVDARDIGGARGWDWIKKGIPIRVEIGPRDMAADSLFVGRRDRGHREKESIPRPQFVATVADILEEIQRSIYDRAVAFMKEHTVKIDANDDFYAFFTPTDKEQPELHGGFSRSPWCGSSRCEAKIKDDLQVTIRCIPFDAGDEEGRCICCGEPAKGRVVFSKAY
jgi:prolyl-tRNA synthetase